MVHFYAAYIGRALQTSGDVACDLGIRWPLGHRAGDGICGLGCSTASAGSYILAARRPPGPSLRDDTAETSGTHQGTVRPPSPLNPPSPARSPGRPIWRPMNGPLP